MFSAGSSLDHVRARLSTSLPSQKAANKFHFALETDKWLYYCHLTPRPLFVYLDDMLSYIQSDLFVFKIRKAEILMSLHCQCALALNFPFYTVHKNSTACVMYLIVIRH